MIVPNDEIKKDLLYVVNQMPKNYLGAIKGKIKSRYKESYISGYFRGRFVLTLENECILDAALELLEEQRLSWEKRKKKIQKIIG